MGLVPRPGFSRVSTMLRRWSLSSVGVDSAWVSRWAAGAGLVGWFPLGPREAYYPSYHVSPSYIRQVNVTNTRITNINVTNINVTNINYVNRNAIVAMPQNSFASAQPVQRAAVRVDANQMRQAQVIGAAPKVAPQRESVLANSSGRKASAPPAAIANRPVVAKLAPPPRAVPFAAKQQMLQQHPGTPVAPAQLQTLRAQAARQNPAPGRMQVQPINTKQVHPVTPTVRPGPAPTFAQRPAQPQARPGQPPNKNPLTQPVPAARPQNLPPARGQAQPRRPAPPPASRLNLRCARLLRPASRLNPRCARLLRSVSRFNLRCAKRLRSVSRFNLRCARRLRSASRFNPRCARLLRSVSRFNPRCARRPRSAAGSTSGAPERLRSVSRFNPRCAKHLRSASRFDPRCARLRHRRKSRLRQRRKRRNPKRRNSNSTPQVGS